MQKNNTFRSGLFNARVLLAFALSSVGAFIAIASFAATPSSGSTRAEAKSPPDSILENKHANQLSSNGTDVIAGNWSIVASPNATGINFLIDVTCVSASNCWAVGYDDTRDATHTLIEHWNGTAWAIVPSPNAGSGLPAVNNRLVGVTCASASDCWAVGYWDHLTPPPNNVRVHQTLILHWDGTSWAIVPSPSPSATGANVLYDVACASASDCWAVGYYETASGADQTLIEHWNGISWSIVVSANTLPTDDNQLLDVTCTSASNCWAVGRYQGAAQQTLIERWNGISWAIVPSPNTSSAAQNVLLSVTCASASDCWAVGYGATSTLRPLIERWNGTLWSIVSADATGTDYNTLQGVTCASASDCWAVGYSAGPLKTLIERRDGTSWAAITSPNTNATSNLLFGVTCASASDCWAVGFNSDEDSVQTLIMRYRPPVQLTGLVSRKAHGGAQFDINLPTTGTPGVECRTGGVSGDYRLIFSFANPLTSVGGASVTSGTGSVSSHMMGANTYNYIVNLTGVTNAQVIRVRLTNVNDSAGNSSTVVPISMGVLIGDTTGNGSVNSSDIGQTKSKSGQTATATNFRTDVTVNGSINSSDIGLVKTKSGTSLP